MKKRVGWLGLKDRFQSLLHLFVFSMDGDNNVGGTEIAQN